MEPVHIQTTPSADRLAGGALVGRDRELAELLAALDEAVAGRGAMFMVGGEAGVGKTRLVDTLAAEAAARGVRSLWGRCWEGGGAPAFWPWTQVIRGYAREHEPARLAAELGHGGPHVAQIVPELRDLVPGLGEPPPLEPDSARFALFDAVTSFLREAARTTPLLLVFDDVHSADPPSLLLLRFLGGDLRGAHILAVQTYRETGAGRHDGELLGDLARASRRIPLRGLHEQAVARLVEDVTGEAPSPDLVSALHAATDGNPFFVDETVRLLLAEGRLEAGAASPEAVPIPPGVRDAIRQRLGALSEPARGVLSAAAVVGREFSLTAVAEACGLGREAVAGLLDEAVGEAIVIAAADGPGRYAFAHQLVRETIYDDLPAAQRLALHQRVGEALERVYAGDPGPHLAELAHHFSEAALAVDQRAIDYSVRAGERAMAQLAYEEAARHFERALGIGEAPDDSRRCDLLIARGEAYGRAGQSDQAKASYLEAAALARKLGSPERLARAALGHGAGLGGFEYGVVDEIETGLLREAAKGLAGSDSALLARVLGRLAVELYFAATSDERENLSREAVEMATRVADPAALASVLSSRHLALWGPGNLHDRLDAASEVLRLGSETGDRDLLMRGHAWHLSDLAEVGEIQQADREIALHARLADETRDPHHLWIAALFAGMRALLDGRLGDAERLCDEALAVGQRAQERNAMLMYAGQMLWLRHEQGRLAEVERAVSGFAAQYPAMPAWRCGSAFVAAELGRESEARAELERLGGDGFASVPRDGEWLAAMSLVSDACAAAGDRDAARVLYDLCVPYTGRNPPIGHPAACLGAFDRRLGRLAGMLGLYGEAEGHFEAALALNARMGARPSVARTQLDYARMLLSRGDGDRAAELLDDAARAASGLGMAGVEAAAGELLEESRGARAPAVTMAAVSDEEAVLARTGEYWTVRHGDGDFHLKDAKGLHYLARLLADPDVEVHALDLVGGSSAVPAPGAGREADLHAEAGGAGETLDTEAKAAYRRRLDELREEIDEAESWADPERAARAREEMEFLRRELARAVGLGGRSRRTGSSAERARVHVTRALRTVIERVAEQDAALGRYLETTVRTGTFCSYAPDPRAPIAWRVQDE